MQERKRLEEAISDSTQVAAATSDIDTLFELSREGENVTGEIEREMKTLERAAGAAGNRDAALGRE